MDTRGEGFFRQIRPASLSDPLFTLLVANAITIILALVEGWNLIYVLLVYWFQSVTIGFFTALQILLFRGTGTVVHGHLSLISGWFRNIGMAGFFCVHYGLFHVVYLMFILAFAGIFGLNLQGIPGLLPACALFFVTHLYSFLFYRKREEMAGLTQMQIMGRPYERIIPMHLTLLAGGFIGVPAAAMGMDVNRIILLIFLALKTVADLRSHVRKHQQPSGMSPEWREHQVPGDTRGW